MSPPRGQRFLPTLVNVIHEWVPNTSNIVQHGNINVNSIFVESTLTMNFEVCDTTLPILEMRQLRQKVKSLVQGHVWI